MKETFNLRRLPAETKFPETAGALIIGMALLTGLAGCATTTVTLDYTPAKSYLDGFIGQPVLEFVKVHTHYLRSSSTNEIAGLGRIPYDEGTLLSEIASKVEGFPTPPAHEGENWFQATIRLNMHPEKLERTPPPFTNLPQVIVFTVINGKISSYDFEKYEVRVRDVTERLKDGTTYTYPRTYYFYDGQIREVRGWYDKGNSGLGIVGSTDDYPGDPK